MWLDQLPRWALRLRSRLALRGRASLETWLWETGHTSLLFHEREEVVRTHSVISSPISPQVHQCRHQNEF